MRPILRLLMVCSLAAAADLTGDGFAELPGPRADPDNDGSFDSCPALSSNDCPLSFSDSIVFDRVWDSGTLLNNQWDADCGYFDADSFLDILGMHFSPNQLHVFESDGAGGYRHVWTQTESLPPGSYGALGHGDPDEDGQVELLGGDVSTLGKVVLFENAGDDSWAEPHVLFRTNLRLRAIRIADTNQNDTAEIVLFCGTTDGGKVQVWEHDAAPGVHSYRLLYEYTTVSYLFNGEVGDADNDGYPEILLGIGGGHGYPMYVRRLVYDPGTRTYSHHMYEHPEVIGLCLAPHVADIDSNGRNELLVGSSGAPIGQLHAFRHTAGDTFQCLWTSQMTTSGNVISAGSGRFQGRGRPYFFAAPFGGAVYGFVADDTACHAVSYFGTSGPVRSIDHCRDHVAATLYDQLLICENTAEQAVIWRAQTQTGILDQSTIHNLQSTISVAPNPVRSGSPVRLRVVVRGSLILPSDFCLLTSAFTLYDPSGRLVFSFPVSRLPSAVSLPLHPGVYIVRCGTATARLVVTD